jgi:hypothetical protein
MKLLPALALFVTPLAAQGFTATVNDPASHGTVGDSLLSLDEAIRVMNDTSFLNSLSPAERARFSGSAGLLQRIRVDAAVTPTITMTGELTPVIGIAHSHMDVYLTGINGMPVLDGGSRAITLNLKTNHAHVENFVVKGGAVGIDYDTTGHYHPGHGAHLHELAFHDQTVAGLRVRVPAAPVAAQTPIELEHVHFHGLPIAIDIQDAGTSGTLTLVAEHVHVHGGGIAVNANVSSTGNGFSAAEFFRMSFVGVENAVRVRRTQASDSQFFMRFVHGEMTATRSALDVQGSATADTVLHHHHLDLRAGTAVNDYALLTWPRTARFDVHGSENRFDGNVLIQANRNTRRIWHQNNRYRNGSFGIDNEGVPPEFEWNRYESSPVTILAGNRTPVQFKSCEFVRSPVSGLANIGTATLTNGFLDSSPISGQVVTTTPATAAWIGHATVLPQDPPIGGFVDLTVDLHPGTAAVWLIGLAEPRPATTNYPFRWYLSLTAYAVVPQVVMLRDRIRLPIPNDASLRGAEFFAQPIMGPVQSQSWVPSLTLPIGGRIAPK